MKSNLIKLMTKADIAISAGGQTLYELAATGTPTIAIQVADNQVAQMAEFGKLGTIIPLVFTDKDEINKGLCRGITELLMSRATRLSMSTAGQDLIDGNGTVRCAKAVHEIRRTNNS